VTCCELNGVSLSLCKCNDVRDCSECLGTDVLMARSAVLYNTQGLSPVVALSMGRGCGRSLAGVVLSNPTVGMDICLLRMLCVVR